MRGRGKGSFGQALLRSLKSTHRHQDLSFFGTITRFASQSGCFIYLMNPTSNNFASSSPIACLLGSEKCQRVCLTGLNHFRILRLCPASLRGIPGMSEGCQANMSQFSCRNSRSAASTAGFNCAPMEAVFVGSKLSLNMQQRVTPKSLIVENKRRDYGRVRNHLKVILSNQSVGLFL